jgi:hypothetical protein
MYSIRNGYHCFARGTRILPTLLALVVLAFLWATPSLAEEKKSVDEVARELANPNSSLATLRFKNQYRWVQGRSSQCR